MTPTSDETDCVDHDRRRALAVLGLWAAAALLAPVLINSRPALAQGNGGDDGGDDDGHGDDDDDSGHGEGDVRDPSLPSEAP